MPSELLSRQSSVAHHPAPSGPLAPGRPHLRLASTVEALPSRVMTSTGTTPATSTELGALPGLAPTTPANAEQLAALPLVTGSAPTVRAEIVARFTVAGYHCGDTIPALARDCAYAVVLSGGVSSRRESQDATKKLVQLTLPGELFAAGRAAAGRTPAEQGLVSHVALDDTRIATLTAADVEILAMQSPSFGLSLWRETSAELGRAQQATIDLAFLDVPARIAKLLLTLEARYGMSFRGTTRVEHSLSQTDIANIVCASRETVNKTLNDFSRRGWILLEGRSFIVRDRSRLEQRSR